MAGANALSFLSGDPLVWLSIRFHTAVLLKFRLSRSPTSGSAAHNIKRLAADLPARFIVFLRNLRAALRSRDVVTSLSKHRALLTDRAPKMMYLAVDLHEEPVAVPAVLHARAQAINPLPSVLGRAHRAKPVSPVSHRLMADLDTTLVPKILPMALRKHIPDVAHHCEADDDGRGLEVAERAALGYGLNLRFAASGLNRFCSDSTLGLLKS